MPSKRNSLLSIYCIILALFAGGALGEEFCYLISVNADNKNYTGQVVLVKDIQDHYMTMSFRSSFDNNLPERISFPQLEEVQKGGGLTMSRTEPPLYSGKGEELIRITEYGAFDDIERKLAQLAEESAGHEIKGDSREYRSAFLLMNEPTAVAWSRAVRHDGGYSVILNMTDGTLYEFDLDSKKTIIGFDIIKDDYSLRYTLANACL